LALLNKLPNTVLKNVMVHFMLHFQTFLKNNVAKILNTRKSLVYTKHVNMFTLLPILINIALR